MNSLLSLILLSVLTKLVEPLGRVLSGFVLEILRVSKFSSSSRMLLNPTISNKVIWVIAISFQVLLLLLNGQIVLETSSLWISKILMVVTVSKSVTRVNGEKLLLMNTSLVFLLLEVLPSPRVMVLKSGSCCLKRLGLRLMVPTIKSKLVWPENACTISLVLPLKLSGSMKSTNTTMLGKSLLLVRRTIMLWLVVQLILLKRMNLISLVLLVVMLTLSWVPSKSDSKESPLD